MNGDGTMGVQFSLVMATLGRTAEVRNFLEHLDAQSYKNFELILVDQNEDDRLGPVLLPYKSRLQILHVRSEKGLSRARNVGLKHVTGDIVAFPDDDCWYESAVLERIVNTLAIHPEWDGIAGHCESQGRAIDPSESGHFLNRISVWRKAISITIFLRSSVTKSVGNFDESLGAGTNSGFASGEETDYLLRAIDKGYRIYHDIALRIGHPHTPQCGAQAEQKGYLYGRGFGHTLRKYSHPSWFVAYVFCRPLGGCVLSLAGGNIAKARYHFAVLRGRVSGWLA